MNHDRYCTSTGAVQFLRTYHVVPDDPTTKNGGLFRKYDGTKHVMRKISRALEDLKRFVTDIEEANILWIPNVFMLPRMNTFDVFQIIFAGEQYTGLSSS